MQEGVQEGVEIVGRGGEVEPGWGEVGVDARVEFGHSPDWGWGVHEG